MSFQLLELFGDAWVSTPDSAALSIEDDLDLRCRVALDTWLADTRYVFVAKSTGAEEWSFHTEETETGNLQFVWTDTGATTHIVSSSAGVDFPNYAMRWVRARKSGASLQFYWSADDTDDHTAVSWTQLGNTETVSTNDIDSTLSTHVTIGASGTDGRDPLFGFMRVVAIVEDTTVRANPIFADATEWTIGDDEGDTADDTQGNTWTLGEQAEIIGPNIHGVSVRVHAAFGESPLAGAGQAFVWADLTSDLRGVEFQRGRQYELDRIEAGTMNVLLNNNHGNYNSHNTAGAYYPNIKPTVAIRLLAIHGNSIYPLFRGFVERWPVSFPGKRDSVVSVQCADLFKLLALAQAATENRVDAVEALNPVAYWRFGDNADGTGTGHTLVANGGLSFGGAVGVWQDDDATAFDGTDDYATVTDEADVELQGASRTWEAWVYPSGSQIEYVVDVRNTANRNEWLARTTYSFDGEHFTVGDVSGDAAPDEWHHVVGVYSVSAGNVTTRLYIDGAEQGTSTTRVESTGAFDVNIGRRYDGISHWSGRISEIAVYDTALTAAQVATLYDAKTEAYADEQTSERIAYLLDNFTFPISPVQNLETGQTTMDGPNTPTGGSVLEALQTVAETENGIFFIAGDGSATFHDRDYRSTEQSASSGTFGPNNLGIWDIDLGLDDEHLFNEIKVAPDDATAPFVSRDEDSITAHGRRTFERTIYPADANEALDAANWLRASYGEAATRIGTMQLRLGADAALWPVVLGAEISNRYTIEKTTTGDDYSDDHYLEAISMRISAMKTWEVGWQLSPASQLVAFILDDDELGLLDGPGVLGY